MCKLLPILVAGTLSLWISTVSAKVWPWQTFQSSSFEPPVFVVHKSGAPLGRGHLIFSQLDGTKTGVGSEESAACLIMDDEGELIWNGPIEPSEDLQVQTYNGKQVLTYWTGVLIAPFYFYGHFQMLDEKYEVVKSFCPDFGNIVTPDGKEYSCYMDLHESTITPEGTLMAMAYNVTQRDLTAVGGPTDGWIFDCLFFEFDLETGEQLFRWSALEAGIPFTDSQVAPPSDGRNFTGQERLQHKGYSKDNPWIWFHMNAVQKLPNGDYFANSRLTWSTYRINPQGETVWKISGVDGGDFTIPEMPLFAWQHHARLVDDQPESGVFHLFNNFNTPFDYGHRQSTIQTMKLDYVNMSVTMMTNFTSPEPMYSPAQGSHDILDNGNHFVLYGSMPWIKEFGPEGDERLSIQFGPKWNVSGYRAHRQEWVGRPSTLPSLVVTNGTAFMSWNGATEIANWVVFHASWASPNQWIEVARMSKKGFEMAAKLGSTSGFAKVAAYDRNDVLLGESVIVPYN